MPLVGRTSTSSSQRGHPRSVGPVPSKRERERESLLWQVHTILHKAYRLEKSSLLSHNLYKYVLITYTWYYTIISSWIVFANQAITTSTCQGLLPLREFVTKFYFGTRLAIHLHQSIKSLLVSGPWLETPQKKIVKKTREKWSSLTTEKPGAWDDLRCKLASINRDVKCRSMFHLVLCALLRLVSSSELHVEVEVLKDNHVTICCIKLVEECQNSQMQVQDSTSNSFPCGQWLAFFAPRVQEKLWVLCLHCLLR